MASTSTSTVKTTPQNQPIVFTTQTAYPLPTQKYMIPTLWKRYHLSQLVNKALGLSKPLPFDFLIKGEVLRTTVAEWCAEHEVGEEETLEIEYIESVMPPQRMAEFPHEDWVSCVSCKLPSHFLTSAYDGHFRAFDLSRSLALNVSLHSAPITSFAVLPQNNEEDGDESTTLTIASASHDLTARLTRIRIPSLSSTITSNKNSSTSIPLASLHLHTAPVSSVSCNSSGTHLLTSSWDGLVGVWDTSIPNVDEVSEPSGVLGGERKKRRRLMQKEGEEDVDADNNRKAKRKAPLTVLKSHIGRVSQAVFRNNSEAISCGFDSTVRLWDVESGVCTRTITSSEKPFLSLSQGASSSNPGSDNQLLLATSTDRTLTRFDLRTTALSSAVATFMHPATPSCVTVPSPSSRSPGTTKTNANQVITGAYDGIVRLWDLRSTNGAMASFKAWDQDNAKGQGGKKVLSVDWSTDSGSVGVGGEGGLGVWKVGVEA